MAPNNSKVSSPRRRKNKPPRPITDDPPSPYRKKKRYNFSKRKARFKREDRRSDSSISSEDVPSPTQRRVYKPPSPPRAVLRSVRRSKEPPTCLLFGTYRETLYPDYFFCHNCKLYEDQLIAGALHGLSHRNSLRNRCTAKHTEYLFPTQLKVPEYCEKKGNAPVAGQRQECVISTNDLEVDNAKNSPTVTDICNEDSLLEDFKTLQAAFEGCQELIQAHAENQQAYLEKMKEEQYAYVESLKVELSDQLKDEFVKIATYIDDLKTTIATLKKKIHNLRTQVSFYQRREEQMRQERLPSTPLNNAIVSSINSLVESKQRYKLLSKSKLATAVAKAVFDPQLLNGVALEEVVNESKKWLRKNVFKPAEILKQMDLNGGTLNYEGIKVLNSVEAIAYHGDKKRVRNRLICTPACLKRVANVLEREGQTICPFKRIHTTFGEGIEFDYAKLTRLVIKAFSLEDAAKERNVNLSASIDAAKVTKNLCHTSAGLKVTDIEGRDPIKGMRSFLVDQNSLRDLQSQNTIFLMKIILTKETKESFKLFDDVFQFFRLSSLGKEERLNDDKNDEKFLWEHLNDLQPFSVTTTTDMAADWKLVGVGGGVKNTEMFCNLCACASSDVHQPNENKCDRFCAHQDQGWRCYHHPIMCRETTQAEIAQEVENLKQMICADLEEVDRNSKVRYYVNPTVNAARSSMSSINYEPSNDDERDEFIDLLMDELILRGLSPGGELEELRQRLLKELQLEHKLRQHLKKLQHCTKLESFIILLLHKIPCILHCENRVGLKLLTMLLREGFSNVQKGYIFGHIRSEKERIEAYAKEVERILNTVILGDEDGPAQWALPYDDDKKSVGVICLDNNRIRKILLDIELLVQASIYDAARAVKYRYGMSNYKNAMCILRQRQEFSDDKIIQFQHYIDLWFQVWIELWGIEGCTNYTHLLSSGHMAEYMYKWRNLYRFSQQGWEKFNHVFSTFYFRRTNHGGRRHTDATKSKLVGIARWLQRRLLWMTGIGDELITGSNVNPNNDAGNNSSDEDLD